MAAESYGAPSTQDQETVRFRVPDMDCASCVLRIQGHLSRVDGVVSVEGNPVLRTLAVALDPEKTNAAVVSKEVGGLGYAAHVERPEEPRTPTASVWVSRQARLAYASMALFLAGWLLHLFGVETLVLSAPLHDVHLPDALLMASALVGGWNFFPKGLRATRTLALDMNFLMTVAILGAIGIGEYTEAAAIAFLFALAELMENYSLDRARASVEALMELAPETARVRRGGEELVVRSRDLIPGDLVVLRPGDRIPADGSVIEGTSAVDQSSITGESMPVEKEVGAEVYAGTINREGFLVVWVRKPAAESTLARIVRMVEEAQSGKTRTERFVERFARAYTPVVTVAAILTVALPVLLFDAPFVTWFVRGLTLLVIACPCALVISTPVAVVSGVTAAARHGVLIKGGTHLEALGDVRVFALDKTGTLTVGHPVVTQVRAVLDQDPMDVLQRAAAIELHSEHPVARAIIEHAQQQGLVARHHVKGFVAVPGKGARAKIEGVEYVVGKPSFAASEEEVPAGLVAEGQTVVAVAREGRLLGWIAVADRARPGAADAVARLRKEGIEHVVMLTGDNRQTADAVGRTVGVDEVRADLLPEDKVHAVKEIESCFGPVAMVGDGVNDAPALASAAVGIVMGAAGSDAALETADVALMGDDLSRLPYVRALSRKARSVIRQNIAVSILLKAVLAVGVPLGLVSLIAAVVVGDMGVSLAVTANALRLGRVRD